MDLVGTPEHGGNLVHINSVATGAGKVFVTKDIYFDQAVLYALNEADGTVSWTYAFGTMASEGPPAVATEMYSCLPQIPGSSAWLGPSMPHSERTDSRCHQNASGPLFRSNSAWRVGVAGS